MIDNKKEIKLNEAKPEEKKEENNEVNKALPNPPQIEVSVPEVSKTKIIIDTTKQLEKIVLNSENEKRELERIRRWKVQISDIFVTSFEMFDCFLQFTVGGDLKISTFNIPEKNKKGKIVEGQRGYSDCTEVKEILKLDAKEKFAKEIDIEIRESIINLMRQHLIIECWDYNRFKLNNYLGFVMIDLMKIVKGSIYQSVIIEKKIPGEGRISKPVCKVEFKIIFQEIWDFVLTFEDWSATNMNYLFLKPTPVGMRPGIQFYLKKTKQLIYNTQGKKETSNPEWSVFNTGGTIRDILNGLENQEITINLLANSDALIQKQKKEILIDLRGIIDNGLIKTYVSPDASKDKQLEALRHSDDLPDTTLTGKIKVNLLPKFRQIGFESMINEEEIYICVFLQKVIFPQPPPHCRLAVNVFLTVEFNGKTIETNRIPIQINDKKIQQHMYFLFGVPNEILTKTKEERAENIKEKLKFLNEVTINMWVEDAYKCLDFIGKFSIELMKIFEKGVLTEKKYKKDEGSDTLTYMPRVLTGEDYFESSYLKTQDMKAKYEVWFFPEEYTKNVDIKEANKRKIKTNPIFKQVEDILNDVTEEYKEMVVKLTTRYFDYKKRFFEFMEDKTELEKKEHLYYNNEDKDENKLFHIKDQNGDYHLINSYLSKLTIQDIKLDEIFLSDDIAKILKEKSTLEKVCLPINNPQGLLHYMRCLRYITNNYEYILLSPDYFMQSRKGTKYEHAIFLACLLMNFYSSKYSLNEEDGEQEELNSKIKEEMERIGINADNDHKLNQIGKEIELEQKMMNKEREFMNDKSKQDNEKLELIPKEESSKDIITVVATDTSRLDKTTDRSVTMLLKKEDNVKTITDSSFLGKNKDKDNLFKSQEKIKKELIEKHKKQMKNNKNKKKKIETKFDTVRVN